MALGGRVCFGLRIGIVFVVGIATGRRLPDEAMRKSVSMHVYRLSYLGFRATRLSELASPMTRGGWKPCAWPNGARARISRCFPRA